jgi:hypothetical protein
VKDLVELALRLRDSGAQSVRIGEGTLEVSWPSAAPVTAALVAEPAPAAVVPDEDDGLTEAQKFERDLLWSSGVTL